MKPNIAVINASTVLKDEDVQKALPSFQIQVTRDFCPIWGIDTTLTFFSKDQIPPKDYWQLVILDNSDQAGALGYHDRSPAGLPLGKVFAGTDIRYGYNWTITFSHELLEMLADPEINLTVFNEAKKGGRLYAYENCDAVEDDSFGYEIDGVMVSDFVTPLWFMPDMPTGSQFDFKGHVTNPLELMKGGYISYYDIKKGGGWKQSTADTLTWKMIPTVGSRREKRARPRDQWLNSIVKNIHNKVHDKIDEIKDRIKDTE
jgi:hypothetical protein